jgi:hypothetical protein
MDLDCHEHVSHAKYLLTSIAARPERVVVILEQADHQADREAAMIVAVPERRPPPTSHPSASPRPATLAHEPSAPRPRLSGRDRPGSVRNP